MGDLKLLPCPFCGDAPTLNDYTDAPAAAWVLSHRNRQCPMSPFILDFPTGEAAVALWNRRSTPHTGGEADLRNDIARVAEGVIWKHSDADAFQAQKCAAMIVEAVLEILQPQGGR